MNIKMNLAIAIRGVCCLILLLGLINCTKDTIINVEPTIDKTSHPAITNLRVIYVDTNSVKVVWNVQTDTSKYYLIDNYDIIYSKDSQAVANWDTVCVDIMPYTPSQLRDYEKVIIDNIDSDSNYYFALRFFDVHGFVSEPSNIVNLEYYEEPEIEYGTPAEVENFRVRRVGEDYIDLIWNLPQNIPEENTISEYHLRYAEYDGNYFDWFGWRRLVKDTVFFCKASPGDKDSIRIGNLDSGRKYYFKLFTQRPSSNIWPIELISSTTRSKNSFTWRWQFNNYGFYDIAALEDSNKDILIYGADGYNIFVSKFDTEGNQLWHNYYDKGNIQRMIETEDHNYFIAGHTRYRELILQKISSDGRLLWKKLYPIDQSQYVLEFKQTADNGFLIITRVASYQDGNQLISRIDSDGTLLWTNTYDSDLMSKLLEPAELANGDFLIMGLAHTSYPDEIKQLVKLKLDSYGNQIGLSSIDLQNSNSRISNAKITGYDEISVLGYIINLSTGLSKLEISKYNYNGVLLNRFNIDKSNYLVGTEFIKTDNGGYLIAAKSNRTNQETLYTVIATLVKLGPGGNIIWEKSYPFASRTGIVGLIPQPDWGYIVAAELDCDSWMMNATIFRIDGNGEF